MVKPMKASDVLKKFGDVNIPEKTLIALGIEEEDHLIDAKEVSRITGFKDGYGIIRQLKKEHCLSYDGARIALSIVKEKYGLK
jgi:hypothetical protein